jgi:hypothetical protein
MTLKTTLDEIPSVLSLGNSQELNEAAKTFENPGDAANKYSQEQAEKIFVTAILKALAGAKRSGNQ